MYTYCWQKTCPTAFSPTFILSFEWCGERKPDCECAVGQNWLMMENPRCLVLTLLRQDCPCFLRPPLASQLLLLVCAGFSACVFLMVLLSWRTQMKKGIYACRLDVAAGSCSSSASLRTLPQGIRTTHTKSTDKMSRRWNVMLNPFYRIDGVK